MTIQLGCLTWKMKSDDIVSKSDGGSDNNTNCSNSARQQNREMNGNDKKTLSKYTIEKSVVRSYSYGTGDLYGQPRRGKIEFMYASTIVLVLCAYV